MSTQITVSVSEELASRLRLMEDKVDKILELGLRHWQVLNGGGFDGLADVMETLATLPDPADVLAMRPSQQLQSRIDELLEKNRTTGLGAEEEREWQQYEFVEHLVRIAKARAALKLKHAGGEDEPDTCAG